MLAMNVSLYASDAAHGVIVMKTKRGSNIEMIEVVKGAAGASAFLKA